MKYRGLGYSGGFYNSSYDQGEMAWAAVWLYFATGTSSYLNDIVSTDASGNFTGWMNKIISNTGTTWQNIWVMSWDTKWGGVFSLLDPLVAGNANVPTAVQQLIHYFDKWQVQYWSHVPHDNPGDTNFIGTTPAGFGYLTTWGSARYNTAAQLEALAYRKNFPADPQSVAFTDWAMGQMDYLMGDNPAKWSYIVGFGAATPGVGAQVGGSATAASHPHHGAPSSSASTPPSGQTSSTTGTRPPRRSSPVSRPAPTPLRPTRTSRCISAANSSTARSPRPRPAHRCHPEPHLPGELRHHDADE